MNDIDLMTLQLLSSKKKYNQYLANTGAEPPSNKYKNAVLSNVNEIKSIIGKYLLDPDTQISNDLDNAIESCFKTVLDHISNIKEIEKEEYDENFDSTYDYKEPEPEAEEQEYDESALEYLRV